MGAGTLTSRWREKALGEVEVVDLVIFLVVGMVVKRRAAERALESAAGCRCGLGQAERAAANGEGRYARERAALLAEVAA